MSYSDCKMKDNRDQPSPPRKKSYLWIANIRSRTDRKVQVVEQSCLHCQSLSFFPSLCFDFPKFSVGFVRSLLGSLAGCMREW